MQSGSQDALGEFHPLIQSWFRDRFAAPTPPQEDGWPAIRRGTSTLISAPTGSGKTLAAFLGSIDALVTQGLSDGALPDEIHTLYISPLKALSNDVKRNLEDPLAELRSHALAQGELLPDIRVAVRTGDTPASERASFRKKPPHIFVTTPESLYILLTAQKSRAALATVRTVIVDEIHAIAGDKRGAHLSLSLERLERLAVEHSGHAPVRVGLSATQKPIERIASLLVGSERPAPLIVDSGHAREIDLRVELTDDELGAIATTEMCHRVYDRVAELVKDHETTLIFVNTRRLVERVAYQLEERLGEGHVVAHHGSLSRKLRFAAEQKLKSGDVKCAVATASLELGIDVGSVDLVVQIGSPRSIATLLQRVGRSGHSLGKTPKGRLFALTRDQLVECAALIRAIRRGNLDEIVLPRWPRDILAQQIVAACACEDWDEDELFHFMRQAKSYEELPRSEFDAVIEVLSEGMSTIRGRRGARLHRDRIANRVSGRRGARLAAITCGGAIPDNANYPVVLYPEETPVGSLDEDFAIESSPGDVFLLGNTAWQIRRVEAGRVLVEDAKGRAPNVPFWFGEAPARTRELSVEIAELRAEVEERLLAGISRAEVAAWLSTECQVPIAGTELIYDYLAAARAALGALPTQKTIVVERFFDDGGGMQLVIHSPLGGRINKAWGLALRKRFCRSFNFELQAAATDDGIIISLGQPHSFPLSDVFEFLSPENAQRILEQAVLDAPVFGVRWRWNSTRALAVLRRTGGKKVPPHILRMRTDDLLSVVFPMQQACLENVVGDIELPDHPLVNETMDNCLHEFMDVDGLVELVRGFKDKSIHMVTVDTSEPSPLSHEIVSANPYAFLDEDGLEERRTRAVSLPRGLKVPGDARRVLSPEAVAEAEAQMRPVLVTADELHDHLMSAWLLPVDPLLEGQHRTLFLELVAGNRATEFRYGDAGQCEQRAWVAAERLPLIAAMIQGNPCPELPELPFEIEPRDAADVASEVLRHYLALHGPSTSAALATHFGLPGELVSEGLGVLEADASVLRGSFTQEAEEWVERVMLGRIHRIAVGRLRKRIEPVDAAALMRFLFRWQRVVPGAQLIGPEATERAIEQLAGFEAAAGAWESELLPARVAGYSPAMLDSLCLSGRVSWARLSARAAGKHVAPTRAAPLSLFLREDSSWLRAPNADSEIELSDIAQRVHAALENRGALFLPELIASMDLAPNQIEDALWELSQAGLATADGFASLRVLVDRKAGQTRSHFDKLGNQATEAAPVSSTKWLRVVNKARRRDRVRPKHAAASLPTAAGRWSLLHKVSSEALDPAAHARLLLCRYGVVFRDLLAREANLPPWRSILLELRAMEARGEIRGGRFVSGFVGEQFALHEAVEGLRAARRPGPGAAQIVRIAATDPLNLVGVTAGTHKVPAVIGNAVLYRNGAPIASIEGGELIIRSGLEEGEHVGEDLSYRPPPRASAEQFSLPL